MELTQRDKEQLRKLGIKEEYIYWQIEMFKKGTPYVNLIRPCTIGDGIRRLSDSEAEKFASLYEERARQFKKVKFVPASGAATRMFKALSRFYNEKIGFDHIKRLSEEGDQDAKDLIIFLENIEKFAFYDELCKLLQEKGLNIDDLLKKRDLKTILHYILTEEGLGYSNLPKALIKFHKYKDETRTAFEEHLVEASGYAINKDGCHLHFTVSPEHEKRFLTFFDQIKDKYEGRYCFKYNVEFSLQAHSTDTIAVDMENRPFRLEDGSLLLRPAGHGALLQNLNSIDADIIFISNIDNVVPDRLKPVVSFWKKVLAGFLIMVKEKMDLFLKDLSENLHDKAQIYEIIQFCKEYFFVDIPEFKDLNKAKEQILKYLNRPLRVCGMVKNVKEPGGGPFWIKDSHGNISIQIVESAQVNMSSQEQRNIFNSATHFNPVNIVCSIKDWKGKKFDLEEFRDKEAVFITIKSKDGRELKALELPGLWNGGMAYWNTIFIEVPFITFNPVKKVTDLLRETHQ